MAKKKVTHVNRKDGTTWCGAKPTKKAPFDADPCQKCKALVREAIEGATK